MGPTQNVNSEKFLDYFQVFFNEEIMNKICDQSNPYADKNGTKLCIEFVELKAFVGVLVIMGFLDLPSMKLYWVTYFNFHVEKMTSVFTMKCFLNHLNNNFNTPKPGSLILINFSK